MTIVMTDDDHELNVILVGEKGSGKTTLVQSLQTGHADTLVHGISTSTIVFRTNSNFSIQFNVWEIGISGDGVNDEPPHDQALIWKLIDFNANALLMVQEARRFPMGNCALLQFLDRYCSYFSHRQLRNNLAIAWIASKADTTPELERSLEDDPNLFAVSCGAEQQQYQHHLSAAAPFLAVARRVLKDNGLAFVDDDTGAGAGDSDDAMSE